MPWRRAGEVLCLVPIAASLGAVHEGGPVQPLPWAWILCSLCRCWAGSGCVPAVPPCPSSQCWAMGSPTAAPLSCCFPSSPE